ncbi:hypothetical protein FXN61_46200, partial [Lentzea sp. PSKA42]|nr:hypothetical protein [Lentzea indica]
MSTTNTILATTTAAATAGYLATSAYALHLFKRLHIDALTGLGNREALGILAHRAATRRPGAVGLLLLDIDNFKGREQPAAAQQAAEPSRKHRGSLPGHRWRHRQGR